MLHQELIDHALETMQKMGADLAQVVVEQSDTHELNTESQSRSHVVKLFRTTEETKVHMTYIKDQKKATTRVNQPTREMMEQAVTQLVSNAKSAPADPAYDIAPKVHSQSFSIGTDQPDFDRLYESLSELCVAMKRRFPKISGDFILAFDLTRKSVGNTHGLALEESKGKYTLNGFFGAKEGTKITSFNYTQASMRDIPSQLIGVGMLDELLDQTCQELEVRPFDGKFVGDLVITPLCMADFLQMIASNALTDGVLISGTSPLKDKIGEKVASDQLTWESRPRSSDIADGYAITEDGFIAQNMSIIESGVLKSHLLSQYGANKTGMNRALNHGRTFELLPGTTLRKEMIEKIDRGILLSRFSGGVPAANGDFSGVAKNSFYIEKGKLQYPISEVMVSGNLYDLIAQLQGVSQERVHFGWGILPWIHGTELTISGK